eukprot:3423484-Pyramimonas_sp.AAC.2
MQEHRGKTFQTKSLYNLLIDMVAGKTTRAVEENIERNPAWQMQLSLGLEGHALPQSATKTNNNKGENRFLTVTYQDIQQAEWVSAASEADDSARLQCTNS